MAASLAAQQHKWQTWYSSGDLPWDARRPSSQLVAYMTNCDRVWQQHLAPTQLSPTVKAGVWLPPVAEPHLAGAAPVVHSCPTCPATKPAPGSTILEIGAGTGSSSVWLAQQGYHVVAVDLVPDAVAATRQAAAAAGVADRCAVLCMDVFALPVDLDFPTALQLQQQQVAGDAGGSISPTVPGLAPPTGQLTVDNNTAAMSHTGHFSMVYDSQTFHVLRLVDEQRLVNRLVALLAPGGLLFLLTGNASEPAFAPGKGPAVLTEEELLGSCLAAGLQLRHLAHTRFDETRYYREELRRRPLAWCALLQKPAAAAAAAPGTSVEAAAPR